MTDERPPARRGRPPDLEARRRTLELATTVLKEGGYAGLTMDLLARRSGVSKKSLYRWWPNKAAVAAEALAAQAEVLPVDETGDSRAELLAIARNARRYATADELPLGFTAQLSIADQRALGRSYMEHVIRPRRLLSRDALDRVVARGDLPQDTDTDALLDLWSGFAVYRHNVRGVTITDHLVEQLVDMALSGSVPRLT
ncbi:MULTISPECIES: TetR/AcrR family transcriptional regulator [Streptacidiphilus]|uniref:TetR/AcrR family transcriptional regulator n=2 Tax=Streptacidiphilus TaxID=228398 RepID=A0ABV6UPK8_9ACTN|nr:TetR/AcrR family transcriptional regulator [Streptacidiphilus jeojiense]